MPNVEAATEALEGKVQTGDGKAVATEAREATGDLVLLEMAAGGRPVPLVRAGVVKMVDIPRHTVATEAREATGEMAKVGVVVAMEAREGRREMRKREEVALVVMGQPAAPPITYRQKMEAMGERVEIAMPKAAMVEMVAMEAMEVFLPLTGKAATAERPATPLQEMAEMEVTEAMASPVREVVGRVAIRPLLQHQEVLVGVGAQTAKMAPVQI